MDLPPPIPFHALLAPALSSLATDLNTTPDQLADWLASPELTEKLAAIVANLEAIEHLRALAARAPATAVCRSLLTTADPIEQRRVAATLLRTPIHTPRTHLHSSLRTRSASKRLDPQSPAPTARRSPSTDSPAPLPTPQDLESLLSLLLASDSAASQADTPPPGGMLAARSKHVPSTPQTAMIRPGTLAPSLDPAPTLHRRTPPSRAASLLSGAGSTPPPNPRPP